MPNPRMLFGPLKSTAGLLARALALSSVVAAIIFCVIALKGPRVQAGQESEWEHEDSEVEIGIAIAPVPLNLHGKSRRLVGLGSYIVNAQVGCNGCHSKGPKTEFIAAGNPYLLSPPKGPYKGTVEVNPDTYLGGGRDFGPVNGLTHLYSRNLTPDKTGMAEGGHTFKEFLTIMRTGKDYDHVHPQCTGMPDGTCTPAPFNGDVLQIMPWPIYRNMTEHDLHAIYEYLSAIKCIDTNIPDAPYLRNNCP